jgi:heptosyltransferase I
VRVLVIRLGAFGDVLHAMPAATALARAGLDVTWVVDRKWAPLLAACPVRTVAFDRRDFADVRRVVAELRAARFAVAYDLQGLIKSAVLGWLSGAPRRVGFVSSYLRERLAAWFYTECVTPRGTHVVEHELSLVGLAGHDFPLPAGEPVDELPTGPFVLASDRAGWRAKEWPAENYAALAERLPVPLVLNRREWSLPQLIYATRQASAVLGLDSGPMHLAAALGKPGVALFGPTSPERNGPYGGSLTVLRAPGAETSYKRTQEIPASMRALSVDAVFDALQRCLDTSSRNPTPI